MKNATYMPSPYCTQEEPVPPGTEALMTVNRVYREQGGYEHFDHTRPFSDYKKCDQEARRIFEAAKGGNPALSVIVSGPTGDQIYKLSPDMPQHRSHAQILDDMRRDPDGRWWASQTFWECVRGDTHFHD